MQLASASRNANQEHATTTRSIVTTLEHASFSIEHEKLVQAELSLRLWKVNDNLFAWASIPLFALSKSSSPWSSAMIGKQARVETWMLINRTRWTIDLHLLSPWDMSRTTTGCFLRWKPSWQICSQTAEIYPPKTLTEKWSANLGLYQGQSAWKPCEQRLCQVDYHEELRPAKCSLQHGIEPWIAVPAHSSDSWSVPMRANESTFKAKLYPMRLGNLLRWYRNVPTSTSRCFFHNLKSATGTGSTLHFAMLRNLPIYDIPFRFIFVHQFICWISPSPSGQSQSSDRGSWKSGWHLKTWRRRMGFSEFGSMPMRDASQPVWQILNRCHHWPHVLFTR